MKPGLTIEPVSVDKRRLHSGLLQTYWQDKKETREEGSSSDLRINQLVHCYYDRHFLRRYSGGITEEAAERLDSYRFISSHLSLARGALVTSGTSAVWP